MPKNRFDTGILYKTFNGYRWDSRDIFTWMLDFDENGKYVGQWQADCMGEGDIFISDNGDSRIDPLTVAEMESASC